MKPISNLFYNNGDLIKVGERVLVKYGQSYVGGGDFYYVFEGEVLGEDDYAGLVLKVENWIEHYNCSQKFGNSSPSEKVTVSARYDYSKKKFILNGSVNIIGD